MQMCSRRSTQQESSPIRWCLQVEGGHCLQGAAPDTITKTLAKQAGILTWSRTVQVKCELVRCAGRGCQAGSSSGEGGHTCWKHLFDKLDSSTDRLHTTHGLSAKQKHCRCYTKALALPHLPSQGSWQM